MKATVESKALTEVMTDPINRFYRYPVARRLVPLFAKTAITPNQVTYLHTTVGILAGFCVAHDSVNGLYLGAALSEVRLVLDCVDGGLARARNMSSPYGRTVDEIGDAISFIAIAIGMCVRMRRENPDVPSVALTVAMLAVSGLMAWAQDFYRRKFSAALSSGADSVYVDLLAKWKKIQSGEGGFITRFGFGFDWMQVAILQPSARRELRARLDAGAETPTESGSAEVQWILENARTDRIRPSLRVISVMGGDNAISIVNVGLLTGKLVGLELFVLSYGVLTLAGGILLCNLFLSGSRRAVTDP